MEELLEVDDEIINISKRQSNPNLGKKGKVVNIINSEVFIIYEDGSKGQGERQVGISYKKINNISIMGKVSIMFKKLIDSDTQKLVKAGILDSSLELTSKGQRVLNAAIFDANKAALVTAADEIIAEEKEECK